jgi:hypothetical protein
VQAKRFHVNLYVNGDYPVHLLQDDNEAARRAYYTATPELTGWRLPKDKFETGFSGRAGYRLTQRLWLQFSAGYNAIDTRDRFASGTYQNDTVIVAGVDTTRLTGPSDILSRGYDNYSLVDFGLGLRFDVLQTPRVNLGLSAFPVLGYMTFNATTFDSVFSNNNMYVNNVFMGKSQIYEGTLRKYELTSACAGADLAAHADFFILRSVCLTAEAGLNVLAALSLEGTSKVRRSYLARDPSTPAGAVPSDSSYTENCAMIKGNFLGTGDYLMMANPDVKQYDPQGRPVAYQKTYREFSNFRVRAGLGYYF